MAKDNFDWNVEPTNVWYKYPDNQHYQIRVDNYTVRITGHKFMFFQFWTWTIGDALRQTFSSDEFEKTGTIEQIQEDIEGRLYVMNDGYFHGMGMW